MKCEPLPDTTRLVYEERYRDKAEGPVPEFYVGMDYADEKDAMIAGIYSVEPKSGRIAIVETRVCRGKR